MNIGDKVRFLNDVGGGTVRGFQKGGVVLVEDEDGFQIPALESDIVVVEETNELNLVKKKPAAPKRNTVVVSKYGEEVDLDSPQGRQMSQPQQSAQQQKTMLNGSSYLKSKGVQNDDDNVDDEALEARVVRLEMKIRQLEMRIERLEDNRVAREKEKIQAKQQRKQQRDEILEVDLHSHEILDNERGMTPGDIKEYQLNVFRRTMNDHIGEHGKRIVFIHGKGDGVLRKAIIDELKYRYKQCEYQDASFQQYGFGATMVIIH